MASMNPELAAAIIASAKRLGVDPLDIGTAISYETAGTWDPWKAGPTTQWGQHRGLIQWGEPQAKQYGVTKDMSVTDQMKAVESYLVDRGVKPGAGLMDIYSTINAGAPGLYNRSDANNGGAPGTVADKVNSQMADHRTNAARLLGVDAPVGALASAPAATPIDPVSPINPTSTSPDSPVSLAAPGAAAPATSALDNLASALNPQQPGAAAAAPKQPEYAPLQNIQMPQPMAGQSQQIAAAIAKMYGIGV
jgi:hypothetical protein